MSTIDDDDSPDSEEFEPVERDPKEVQAAEAFEEFWSDPCWTGPLESEMDQSQIAAHMSKL